MRRKRIFYGALSAIAVCALLAVAVLFASCGKGGEVGKDTDKGGEVMIEDRGDVDVLLKELDATMDSVDADDFSANRLSDSELGL